MDWLVGVFAEDVPDDHNGLLHNIIDFGLDEVQQGANTTLSWLLYTKIQEKTQSRLLIATIKLITVLQLFEHNIQWKKSIKAACV